MQDQLAHCVSLHAGPFTDGQYVVLLDDFIVSNSPIAAMPSGGKVLAKPANPAPQQQATFCTNLGYKAGCTITSYYTFAGQRVAMRVQSDANATGVVTWLHGDMLGSASVATDAGGNKIAGSDSRYLPFGEARSGFAGSGLPTDRRFTGQISVAGGLIDMNARALDPLLGRFISADTIVPSPADPQSLNRFSYASNAPLNMTDPSGHNPIGYEWAMDYCSNNPQNCDKNLPDDQAIQDRLFSLMFCGNNPDGGCGWTEADWAFYGQNRNDLWSAKIAWGSSDPRFGSTNGLDAFVGHLEKLASFFKSGEESAFVRAIGLVWGGIPDAVSGIPLVSLYNISRFQQQIWNGTDQRRATPYLREGSGEGDTANWLSNLKDMDYPGSNQTHHFAVFFYAGFFVDNRLALAKNREIDPTNPNDVRLGQLAVSFGSALRGGQMGMHELATSVLYALDARPHGAR